MSLAGLRSLTAPPSAAHSHQRAPFRRRVWIAAIELALTTAAILVYFLARGAHPDDVPSSVRRALDIVNFEKSLGIFREQDVQAWFLRWPAVIHFANAFYVWGMYPLMAVVAFWVAATNLPYFRFLRNVMLVSAVMGLVGYWLLPTAPPRLLGLHGHEFGFVDTVHGSSRDLQPAPFLNEYAAIPSFHFAWVLLASVALWANTRSLPVKALAVLVSVLMAWAVVVTGNHFFVDMVLGLAVVAVAWVITRLAYLVPWGRLPGVGPVRRQLAAPIPADDGRRR
ncbi:MAG: phosphatase PAP2 family protein [Dehalococcoidia bacterium]|nr:phosphatase PAP2 family protein [Dehalococcoidia bacterium]